MNLKGALSRIFSISLNSQNNCVGETPKNTVVMTYCYYQMHEMLVH